MHIYICICIYIYICSLLTPAHLKSLIRMHGYMYLFALTWLGVTWHDFPLFFHCFPFLASTWLECMAVQLHPGRSFNFPSSFWTSSLVRHPAAKSISWHCWRSTCWRISVVQLCLITMVNDGLWVQSWLRIKVNYVILFYGINSMIGWCWRLSCARLWETVKHAGGSGAISQILPGSTAPNMAWPADFECAMHRNASLLASLQAEMPSHSRSFETARASIASPWASWTWWSCITPYAFNKYAVGIPYPSAHQWTGWCKKTYIDFTTGW